MILALFDFDGTITTRETMPDFIRYSVSRRRLLLGQIILAPLVIGYKFGFISGSLVRRVIVRFAYTGMSRENLSVLGKGFATGYLPKVLREEAMQRIMWHKRNGHKVVIVSGGLDPYLAPWCKKHGVELLCSSLEHRNGRLTGHYKGEQCVLAEKARRVCESYKLELFSAVYAYGDTQEDNDMLSIATNPYYRWQEIDKSVPPF